MFAGGPDTPQPDFSWRDGRDIVIIRPYPRSAKRFVRYIYAVLDCVYRSAADGGDAKGPGTKFLIDEAASFMKLDNLDEYLDLGRESKVQLTYVLQSVKQLAAKLDQQKAEHLIGSTEIKIIGRTDDYGTAETMSKLSAPTMVHYAKPAQPGEFRGEIGEHQRRLIEPYEITSQQNGEWTIIHGADVWKVRVPQDYYHYRRAGAPQRRTPWGQVDPKEYEVPPILGPANDEEDGPEKSVADRRGPVHAEDDILDDGDGRDGGGDDWLA